MDRPPLQLLRALTGRSAFQQGLLSVCPICFEQTGALTGGARMGAAVLAVTVVAILAAIGRFGWRVMRSGAPDSREDADGPDAAPATAPPGGAR